MLYERSDVRFWFFCIVLIIVQLMFLGSILSGCDDTDREDVSGQRADLVAPGGAQSCMVSEVRYPTAASDMLLVYQGRSFYADGNHLGHDMALPEGTAIHPIGCGVVRIFRPAKGYGRLAVVIEHALPTPLTVVNGNGELATVTTFLTIYGHLRTGQDVNLTQGVVTHAVGDTVSPDDVIGYVDDDTHNGDGAEHVHFGVRLQSAAAAQSVDQSWFRGYDGQPSQRKWYADPVLFMDSLHKQMTSVLWHPPGTVVLRLVDQTYWMLDQDLQRHLIDQTTVFSEGLAARAVVASEAELTCEPASASYVSPRLGHAVVKFTDASTVYEYTALLPSPSRKAFISYEAFQSWGWKDQDIQLWSPDKRPWFFATTTDKGFQTLREGTLVKGDASSEVCVVSSGVRLPIQDWTTFLALGYQAQNIITIPQNTLDVVAGPHGPMITHELLSYCAHPAACVDNCPPETPGGGAGGGDQGETGGVSSSSSSASASSSVSTGVGGAGGQGGSDPFPDLPPPGTVRFQYHGPILAGAIEFQGMWDPPGSSFYDWAPATFALCPDSMPGNGVVTCDLPMPSDTINFLFTVHLPDGRWWGDLSCDPGGGCGQTIGQVDLLSPSGPLDYVMKPNKAGSLYQNGLVAKVP